MEKKKPNTQITSDETLDKIKSMIASGIPLSKAIFHGTVLSFGKELNGSPESVLFHVTEKIQKKAEMWMTPTHLIIKQKDKYKMIPNSTVRESDVLL